MTVPECALVMDTATEATVAANPVTMGMIAGGWSQQYKNPAP